MRKTQDNANLRIITQWNANSYKQIFTSNLNIVYKRVNTLTEFGTEHLTKYMDEVVRRSKYKKKYNGNDTSHLATTDVM